MYRSYYSFDLWLTLIKSNPQFKSERNKLIFEKYNSLCIDYDKVCEVIKQSDNHFNKVSEYTGIHVKSHIILGDILTKLGTNYSYKTCYNLHNEIQELFLNFLPSFYDDNTFKTLEYIKRTSCSITLISNTGFITGSTITLALEKIGLKELIDNYVFSDREGISKPNVAIFDYASFLVRPKRGQKILHVGDNSYADGGCVNHPDFEYFQINSNNKTILDLLC